MEASRIRNFSSREFGSRIESSLRILQNEKFFCDVTIICEGRQIDAHKVVLARSSHVFKNILKLNPHSNPIIFLSHVKFSYLLNILDFMYQGEACIDKRELDDFLTVARDLEVNDLTEKTLKDSRESSENKSKKQRLGSIPKRQLNVDYKIKIDNILDDSRTAVSDLKIKGLEDLEQFADEDFDNESESINIKNNLKESSPKQEVHYFTEEALKDSKESIEVRNKKQRLDSSPKKQSNLGYKINKTDKFDDIHTVVNDLKIGDFEQFEDEDFVDESEGISIKMNLMDSNPKQDLNVEYTINIEKENKNTEKNKIISDPGKGQRLLIRDIAKLSENECFKCEHCNKTFSHKGNLKGHNLSIHQGKIYPCSHCGYKATTKSSLRTHVLSIHEGMHYPCTQCDLKATTKEGLKTHILSSHEGMWYPCSQCDYKATTKNKLRIHILCIHEGMRYPCAQFDHKATTKQYLKRHILTIHEGMRYPCSQCDYKATTKDSLKTHILSVHEGMKYPCSKCDYKATTKGNLTNHILKRHS